MSDSDNMFADVHDPLDNDHVKEELFANLVDRLMVGETVDTDAILRQYPIIGPELVEQLRSFQLMADNEHDESDKEGYEHPEQIGRYQITRQIGRGGFGRVYLAHDTQLQRDVAIKVPNREFLSVPDDVRTYLAEARVLAQLDHPHIVPVYDVGATDQFPCYIVSKFIDGKNLSQLLKERQLAPIEAAKLIAAVADAVHHSHKNGLVHRDIKPSNILVSDEGNVQIVDFGIALREMEIGNGKRFVGTPAYMSPEQARGEGHRVDGRSDIFSLGVVLYELLVGRTPFLSGNATSLLGLVAISDPKPPRQIDDTLPEELERICLKAMAKRSSERYTTAHDFAEDLRGFIREVQRNSSPAFGSSTNDSISLATNYDGFQVPVTPYHDRIQATIIPKGMRSFDQNDADFFLALLPGPRGRDGLPESIRFWKQAIAHDCRDSPFPIGLIYGPSGCGKSSLVKAGLIPRLPSATKTIYLEATGGDTEAKLLSRLRSNFPQVPSEFDLRQTLAALRQGSGIAAGDKVLIVLDQFEQWLHSRKQGENTELVMALRQCDGVRLQCIVMVRDDFWMAITRFMQDLDVRLIEGWNSRAVDLLPAKHARQILIAFGMANGDLPQMARQIDKSQFAFVRNAVESLADDGNVISVRLALFAEMVKGKPWVPSTLREIGGATGVGVAFLEASFGSSAGPPQYRYHQKAARAILSSLIPDSASNIKGHMKSTDELKEVVGPTRRPSDFDELMSILVDDLRLISPIEQSDEHDGKEDPFGREESKNESDGTSAESPPSSFYQLTHDYLVPSLRDWLTRKQRETRRGRARLRLAELAEAWTARPENRYLPTWTEYAGILCLTRQRDRSPAQRKLMRRANSYFGIRGALALLLVMVIVAGSFTLREKAIHRNDSRNAQALVDSLLREPADVVPFAIKYVEPLRDLAIPMLREKFDSGDTDSHSKLVAALALARFDDVRFGFLIEMIRDTPDSNCRSIVEVLSRQRDRARAALLEAFDDSESSEYRARLASILLSFGEPSAAEAMLSQISNDPEDRTRFIATYARWRAGGDDLAEILSSRNSTTFRSGLCCALAEVPLSDLDDLQRRQLEPILLELARTDSDPGVHSAAGLVLRRWGVEVKIVTEDEKRRQEHQAAKIASIGQKVSELERLTNDRLSKAWRSDAVAPTEGYSILKRRLVAARAQQICDETNWYVNSLGMTMIQLKTPLSDSSDLRDPGKVIAIADREVSVKQFREFLKGKNIDWEGPPHAPYSSPSHPINYVDWYLAVRFCNWLSEREGLTPCYPYSASEEEWNFRDEDGYRLPTITEFWFACQASTSTAYSSGSRFDDVRRYASLDSIAPCGDRLPNAWGFFDLHGNVSEWSNNKFGENDREHFGGADAMGSRGRSARLASQREPFAGFRVARTHPRPQGLETTTEQVVRLEDILPEPHYDLVPSHGNQLVAARESVAPDLVSYTSIDETLERSPGTAEWHLVDEADSKSRIEQFLKFAEHVTDPGTANRSRYAEARLLQLAGKRKAALPLFDHLMQADPDRPEPMLRVSQCLQDSDSRAALDTLNRAVLRFPNDMSLWRLWVDLSMNHQGSSAEDLLEFLDAAPAIVKELPVCTHIRSLLAGLRDKKPLRFNCGAKDHYVVNGMAWLPDAFYVGGHQSDLPALEIAECDDPTIYTTIHSFSHKTGGSYLFPLPNGRYRVILSFCEGWQRELDHRDFDVLIENQPVLRNFAPVSKGFAIAFDEQFETQVTDGLLSIDFLPRKNHGDINGIQIQRVDH